MKFRKIPIIKSPKNISKKIDSNLSKQINVKNHSIIKLPLAKTFKPKYFSSSNITNSSSYKQNSTTNYSGINTLNNNTTNITNNNSGSSNDFNKNYISKNETYRLSPFYSPKNSYRTKKILDNNLFSVANDIMRQRRNDKIFLNSLLRNSKNEIINNIKELSLKNYHIDLLRKKRIEIDEKENYINKSLMKSSTKLEKDYRHFLNIVDKLKTEQKKDEEKLGEIHHIYDSTLKELIKETNINKKLNNNIVKTIKLIGIYKRYGSFLYKLFGMTFPYEEITELDNRLKISEDLRERVIKIFGKDEKIDIDMFGNDQTIMKKFDNYEEKLILNLSNKEKMIKENNRKALENKNEINILKQKIRMFKEDLNDAINKKKKLIELMANIFNFNKEEEDISNIYNMKYVDENLKNCIEYINDLGNCLELQMRKDTDIYNDDNSNQNNEFQHLKEYIDYAKDIINCLEEKEKLVNEYTSKINDIMKNGTYKDKQILGNLMAKMKRDNKFKNIVNIKNKREELSNVKRLNAIKRSQRYVLKQKKIFIDAPISKIKQNKTEKLNFKENNEYEYLNYSSEESEENNGNNTKINF